ncbi:MAG: YdiU family protein [Verrucomicrobiales bacterium]|nr:YdiU family protein [Verrucomicrobiales bacterium]
MPFSFDNTYARLPEAFFARVNPTPVREPRWIALNRDLADRLGIDSATLDSDEGLAYLAGNANPAGAEPIAMAYSGHQFGGFSPRLGDGRAILLGEVVDDAGVRHDIQLKGAGPTPFSRRGDGRSALGPVLREYLVSEAMAALGVPTTRALAAVWSGDTVFREAVEPGGVFTRVARSHLRIGTVEYFSSRGEIEHLASLVRYAVARHYPESADAPNLAVALLEGVVERQAALVARWLGLGFIHGVMNTDNMSLSGETIDYGPCAFMDDYHPARKFSFIDEQGRYAYANQPAIAHWNLTRLAEALLPLLAEDEEEATDVAGEVLRRYPSLFQAAWGEVFSAKLGLNALRDRDDVKLVHELLDLMTEQETDFTLTFRRLTQTVVGDGEAGFLSLFSDPEPVRRWLGLWQARAERDGGSTEARQERMRLANPIFIPRNHRIEAAIQAGRRGDFEPFHQLHRVLARPCEEQPEAVEYEQPPLPHEEVKVTFCGT